MLTAEQLLQSIWAALRRIEDNMALPPAPLELPAITIAPPDLADVVSAVTGLKPGPTAEEIAAAIASVLAPSDPQPDGSSALREVAAALEKLDFRLKGMGTQAYGGGSVSMDSSSINQIVNGVHPRHEYHDTLSGGALGADETLTSPWFDVGTFAAVTAFAYFYPAPPTSCTIQWSDDGVNPSAAAVQPVEIIASAIGIYSGFLSINSQSGRYVRLVTVNGATPQVLNAGILWFLTGQYTGIYKALNAALPDYEVALLARAVLAGVKPDGTYANVELTEQSDLRVGFNAFHITEFDYTAEVIAVSGSVTTDFVDVSNFADLQIGTSATQLIQGYVEWSLDGVNVNHNNTTPFAGAGDFHVPIGAQYARFRVVNLAASSCTFDLRVFGNYQATGLFTFPAAAPIDASFPAALVKALITGQKPDGSFVNTRQGGGSSTNHTTTPLGAAGVFTGTWESSAGYVSIGVTIKATVVSATSGIEVQFSDDAGVTTTGKSIRTYGTVEAATGFGYYAIPNEGDYFRIVYTNGGTPQGSFFLQTRLNTVSVEVPRGSIQSPLADSNQAAMTRSVLAGKRTSDSLYDNVPLSASSNLNINIAEAEVPVPILALTSFETNGTASVGTTPVQIATGLASTAKTVSIKANPSNTKACYLGANNSVGVVSGYPLAAGDSVELEVDDTPSFWVRSESGTQTVHWLAVAGSP